MASGAGRVTKAINIQNQRQEHSTEKPPEESEGSMVHGWLTPPVLSFGSVSTFCIALARSACSRASISACLARSACCLASVSASIALICSTRILCLETRPSPTVASPPATRNSARAIKDTRATALQRPWSAPGRVCAAAGTRLLVRPSPTSPTPETAIGCPIPPGSV